jgi:hypothetical protein
MKNVKMILSAVIVFAVVGSALAFKKSPDRDLRFCINGLCELAPYDSQFGIEEPNPGGLWIGDGPCGLPTDPCQPYLAPDVYLSN